MSVRRILVVGEPRDLAVLKQASALVEAIDAEVRALAADMLETMYDAPGIGLAAVQVGELRRLVVMDLAREGEEPQPKVFVNPEVTWASEELASYEEGCLSIPEYFDAVERPARVRVRYQTLEGETVEEEADGLYATCFQHELDHLNGVLFLDHLSRLKRERALKSQRKAAKAA